MVFRFVEGSSVDARDLWGHSTGGGIWVREEKRSSKGPGYNKRGAWKESREDRRACLLDSFIEKRER